MSGRNYRVAWLARETRRLRRSLERYHALRKQTPARPPVTAASLRVSLSARRMRLACFGDGVGDVAWAILIEAYAARLEGRECEATSFGAIAGIARSTAHRMVCGLVDRGLLYRTAPGSERGLVGITDGAAETVCAYLNAAEGPVL